MSHIHNQILPEGTQLGVYEIKKASKIGIFDITYRAWNHHLKEWVEIQEYFPYDFAIRAKDGLGVEAKSTSDKENFEYGLKAFLDQAEILTQIDHPNIVKAENILQFNKTAYLITDYQEGALLSELVGSPASFAETELTFILVSILNALKKIHEYKIVHGGIQPAAILLGKNGEPLLTGFSAARLAIANKTVRLLDVVASGYAAPELYEHAEEAGPAADFYGLGATMYYCITHKQPAASQSRKTAISKGEPDPVAALSGAGNSQYGRELLQAIEWMLQPEFTNRPQTAAEILALLKAEPINESSAPAGTRQQTKDIAGGSPIARNSVWIGAMAGLVGLVIAGLWFVKKPSEIPGDIATTETTKSLLQDSPGIIAATPETKTDQTIAQSSLESGSDKQAEQTQNDISKAKQQPKQAGEDKQLKPDADANQTKTGAIAESTQDPADKPVSKPAYQENIASEQESGSSIPSALTDNSLQQARKQDLPEQTAGEDSVKEYLAAAKKAMKAVRLTTPTSDNAHKYYRMVLAVEPDNAEALAGLQKIVDRYAWFIQKSRAEGKINTARRALQKAESVLPDDPKLQRIREELATIKE